MSVQFIQENMGFAPFKPISNLHKLYLHEYSLTSTHDALSRIKIIS